MSRGLLLLAAALLVLPAAHASLALLPRPASSGDAPPSADLASGCEADGNGVLCSWSWSTEQSPATANAMRAFPIPVFLRTLATVTVRLKGDDEGWQVAIQHTYHRGGRAIRSAESSAEHNRDDDPSLAHYQTTAHVLFAYGSDEYNLTFTPYDARTGASLHPSLGAFYVTYQAEPAPDGAPPARPAATEDFPQIPAPKGTAPPQLDLVAAWLDDARLGDGLFDAHLKVAGALSNLDYNASNIPGAPPVRFVTTSDEIHWDLRFSVGAQRYAVRWLGYGYGGAAFGSSISCRLLRLHDPPAQVGPTEGTADEVIAIPQCYSNMTRLENGTLSAIIPESSVGSPGPGALFSNLSAQVDTVSNGATYSQDRSAPARFPFALGGPAVWDALNGCRYCTPPVPWYMDPLSAENLPNTVQVGGAAVAAGAFLVGLVLVRRRRAKVAALLHEIAAVEEAHERDARGALLALGALDARFARMLREGALTESQYQVVTQRVATAATRFALRQGLGLDDGEPGDAPRRVPVISDAPAPRVDER